jgi:hypothetical protein
LPWRLAPETGGPPGEGAIVYQHNTFHLSNQKFGNKSGRRTYTNQVSSMQNDMKNQEPLRRLPWEGFDEV